MNQYVSTLQVAHAIGVSVTTVKRWVDEGVLPAHKTPGGHRKILLADVLRLVREKQLPQANLSALLVNESGPGLTPEQVLNQMIEAINAMDADLITTLIHGAYRSKMSIETIADKIIGPALYQVGNRWESGHMDVTHEHRVTQACISALYELRSFLRANADRNRPIAIGGAPEHDHYILPTLLAKLTLHDAGFNAINLGPHTPVSAFASAIEDFSPRLVWLSITHLVDEEKFISEYQPLFRHAADRGIVVAIGGQGLSESVRSRMSYTTFGDGMTHLANFARTLLRQTRPNNPPPTTP